MNAYSSGHEKFMRSAIEKARITDEDGRKTPFGAVIVKDDKIIASANNSVAGDHDPTAHAEVSAIRKACKKIKSNDLSGSVIYTTCEPCPMCFSAIWWAKISQIVFGVGIDELMSHSYRQINISCKELNKKGGSSLEITEGVMKKECLKLLQ